MTIVKQIRPPAAPRTAKVKLLKGVCMGPGQDGAPGEIYEIPKHVATMLVSNGQAEYTDEGDDSDGNDAGAASHAQGYETVTVESPSNRDPRPKKKG